MRYGWVLWMLAGAGCAPGAVTVHDQALRAVCAAGIPNLRQVTAVGPRTVLRGGQPTPEGWRCLRDGLHVATVVKLNDAQESGDQGNDVPADALGMRVTVATMPPHDYGLSLRSLGQLSEGPTEAQAAAAVAAVASVAADDQPVYVHCSHGRDRTGLVVGLYRVFVEHQRPETARAEMLTAGFRTVNRGLDRFWQRLFEEGTEEERARRQAAFRAMVDQAMQSTASR